MSRGGQAAAPGGRDRIAEAVWGVIAAKGIAGVSVRSVAAEAEVSPGLVQHYFGSKSQLLHASMERMIERSAAAYDAAAGGDPASALAHAVGHVIPRTARSRSGTAVWYAFVAAAVTDTRAAEILATAKRGQEAEVARLLEKIGGSSDATATARRLLAVADGLATRVLIGDLAADEATALLSQTIDDASRG